MSPTFHYTVYSGWHCGGSYISPSWSDGSSTNYGSSGYKDLDECKQICGGRFECKGFVLPIHHSLIPNEIQTVYVVFVKVAH